MQHRTLLLALLLFLSLIAPAMAATEPAAVKANGQEMLSLPVRVVDPDGKPVEGVAIRPWALRCSQGHGWWRDNGLGGSEPPTVKTDAAGEADVPFPKYAIAKEKVVVTDVTISIDHPDFVQIGSKHIPVLPNIPPRVELPLEHGGSVILRPVEMIKEGGVEGLYAIWSDGRSWSKETPATITDEGDLRLPTMPLGKRSARLARLKGDEIVSLSRRIEFDVRTGEPELKQALMPPPRKIVGKLSDDVPRPVKNGRVKAESLPLTDDHGDGECGWFSWAPVAEDGTFEIKAWPEDDAIQLIALCDGYVAKYGDPPDGIEEERRGLRRPQVYSVEELDENGGEVTIAMEPMGLCTVTTVDRQGKAVAGVKVMSYPNVCWWRGGSQIYCSPLVRCERMFVERDYMKSIDDSFPQPFVATTDDEGRCQLELPAGGESLYVEHPDLELPVAGGRREIAVVLKDGETKQVELKLQPKGTDLLGEQ
jgi:hypothetical protein